MKEFPFFWFVHQFVLIEWGNRIWGSWFLYSGVVCGLYLPKWISSTHSKLTNKVWRISGGLPFGFVECQRYADDMQIHPIGECWETLVYFKISRSSCPQLLCFRGKDNGQTDLPIGVRQNSSHKTQNLEAHTQNFNRPGNTYPNVDMANSKLTCLIWK